MVAVEIRGVLPANSGSALFIGNEDKVFVIQVDHNMGSVIGTVSYTHLTLPTKA